MPEDAVRSIVVPVTDVGPRTRSPPVIDPIADKTPPEKFTSPLKSALPVTKSPSELMRKPPLMLTGTPVIDIGLTPGPGELIDWTLIKLNVPMLMSPAMLMGPAPTGPSAATLSNEEPCTLMPSDAFKSIVVAATEVGPVTVRPPVTDPTPDRVPPEKFTLLAIRMGLAPDPVKDAIPVIPWLLKSKGPRTLSVAPDGVMDATPIKAAPPKLIGELVKVIGPAKVTAPFKTVAPVTVKLPLRLVAPATVKSTFTCVVPFSVNVPNGGVSEGTFTIPKLFISSAPAM